MQSRRQILHTGDKAVLPILLCGEWMLQNMQKQMSKRVHVGWSLGMIWVRETLDFQLEESYNPEFTDVMYWTCNMHLMYFFSKNWPRYFVG